MPWISNGGGGGGGGASDLSDLSDVVLGSPVEGDFLGFDGTNWVPVVPFAPAYDRTPLPMVFDPDTESGGVFGWWATNGFTTPFSNPALTSIYRPQLYTATMSSYLDPVERRAEQATSGQWTTGYECHTANAASSWWKADFGASLAFNLTHVGITGRHDATAYHPRNFKIQTSNDDSTWTDVATVTADGPGRNTLFMVDCAGAANARYIRILQTGLNSGGSNHLVMGEVEMWGTLVEVGA